MNHSIAYTSPVTRLRKVSTYKDKRTAIRDAVNLSREGAKNIDVFYFRPGIGAVSVDWRKVARSSGLKF